MKVAFGLKAHSGWAALVVVGRSNNDLVVVDRRRIDLVNEEWQKQPYHAAEELESRAAREIVKRGIKAAQRIAIQQIRAAVRRERERNNRVAACAVLVANPMPDWTVEQILAVHFRMHQAEGVLFRDALVHAAGACGLKLVALPEKILHQHAEKALGTSAGALAARIARLGRPVGPPWGKDQKEATLAALVALRDRPG